MSLPAVRRDSQPHVLPPPITVLTLSVEAFHRLAVVAKCCDLLIADNLEALFRHHGVFFPEAVTISTILHFRECLGHHASQRSTWRTTKSDSQKRAAVKVLSTF